MIVVLLHDCFSSLLVAGKTVAVRIGDVDSPIVACMSLPSPVLPSMSATTTPLAQTTATPSVSVTSEPPNESLGKL